jgi:hypothetical protein
MQTASFRHIEVDRLNCLSEVAPFESLRERPPLVYMAVKEYNGYEQETAGIQIYPIQPFCEQSRPLLLLKQERHFWHTVDSMGATAC